MFLFCSARWQLRVAKEDIFKQPTAEDSGEAEAEEAELKTKTKTSATKLKALLTADDC